MCGCIWVTNLVALCYIVYGGGYPDAQYPLRNTQGVMHKRSVLQTVVSPIPDLRSSLDDTTAPAAFQGNIYVVSTALCMPASLIFIACFYFDIYLSFFKNYFLA